MEEERTGVSSDEVNLLDYVIVLVKRKKLILGATIGAAIVAAIISLVMTPIYRADTKILPPVQNGSGMAAQLLSQLGSIGALAGSSAGVKTPNDLYISLTKSRTVLDRITDRFDLMRLYKSKTRERARKALGDIVNVRDDKKSGIITIAVEDKNPKRAAEMANAFVEELQRLNTGLAVTEASQRRLFFEEQLKAAKVSLTQAEAGLKTFQEETGAFNIESQAKAIIEGIGAIRAQIAAKEVELKVMKTYSTPQNPDVQRVEQTLNGLRAELGKLESRGGKGHDPLMPTGRMAQIGTDYARQVRDVKFNEVLYGLLLQQYEAAKLDEAKDATIIQVVDKAVPPEKRAKPKRTQMVMLSAIAAFFISVFGAFLLEYWERSSSDPEDRERIDTLKRYLTFRRTA
ncbi:MAG: Tyrosine-protein kinase wzc [Syntrophorhabdus sp. PtaU1.Bin050]|nr:MAG: Tyrosine-protein kinase wzc [Syntrophorhabdus sp. PtaU1.Bin050]